MAGVRPHRAHPATVNADATIRPGAGAATLFSGGVDSFYTLLKYRSGGGASLPVPLTHVLFLAGSRPGSKRQGESTRRSAGCARSRGKPASGLSPARRICERRCKAIQIACTGSGTITAARLPRWPCRWRPRSRSCAFRWRFHTKHLIAHGSTASGRRDVFHRGAADRPRDGAKCPARRRWRGSSSGMASWCCAGCGCVSRTAVAPTTVGDVTSAFARPAVPAHVSWGLGPGGDVRKQGDLALGERHRQDSYEALTEENIRFAVDRGADTWLIATLKRGLETRRRRTRVKNLVERAGLQQASASPKSSPRGSRGGRDADQSGFGKSCGRRHDPCEMIHFGATGPSGTDGMVGMARDACQGYGRNAAVPLQRRVGGNM